MSGVYRECLEAVSKLVFYSNKEKDLSKLRGHKLYQPCLLTLSKYIITDLSSILDIGISDLSEYCFNFLYISLSKVDEIRVRFFNSLYSGIGFLLSVYIYLSLIQRVVEVKKISWYNMFNETCVNLIKHEMEICK